MKTADLPLGHRDRLLPIVAATFAESGYRRTTTADLAERCAVRENVLYRIWPTKKGMFLDAIRYVLDSSLAIWQKLLKDGRAGRSSALRLLEYEAVHQGEFGLYRIVFSGLGEADDPEIREALRSMYRQFHEFISKQLSEGNAGVDHDTERQLLAWALVGLGTVYNITHELGLLSKDERRAMFERVGQIFLKGLER